MIMAIKCMLYSGCSRSLLLFIDEFEVVFHVVHLALCPLHKGDTGEDMPVCHGFLDRPQLKRIIPNAIWNKAQP